MSFTIFRTDDRIKDTGVLRNGDKELQISVDVSAGRIQRQYIELVKEIDASQRAAEAARREKDIEAIEKADLTVSATITRLFFLLFGEEQTEKIVAFYEDDPYQMLADFVPYIRDEISPKIREAQKKRARMYKR